MMDLLLILLGALAIACSAEDQGLQAEWKDFKAKYGRQYKSAAEEEEKYKIFAANMKYIQDHNVKFTNGQTTFKLGINKFADMSHREFVKKMTCFRGNRTGSGGSAYLPPANLNYSHLPHTVDWRTEGAVTPVKDQDGCGACWAFSATGSLEGQYFRKTRNLVPLSEQNLVDCSSEYHNSGCSGGRADNAFDYIKANGGIDTEESYPYVAQDQDCSFKQEDVGATCTGYMGLEAGSEDALKYAVATVGPVSVAIDARSESFKHYTGGVYDEPECTTTYLTHAVLVVGYGSKDGEKYWLVKNSWGEDWGLNGYAFMSRDKDNQCGIASFAVYPLV
ncbi:cathepsin L-like peptidase [Amblyomma americanum]